MDPQTNCPFFKLPQELRDMIYAELFNDLEINAYEYEYSPPESPILRACRLIHEEAIVMYYRNTTLHFDNVEWAIRSLWNRPQQARCVRRILFTITHEHCQEVLSRTQFVEVLDRNCTFARMNEILRREFTKKLESAEVKMHAELCLEFCIPEWDEFWAEG